MCLFSLSLTGTAFSWFSSLAPNSIGSWEQLEQKFHEHFFCGHDELKLSHLTSVRQLRDESVNDYIKRCFSVNIAEKDLADLAFNGLRSHIKERLEGYDFFTVTQVHQRALAIESRSKESQEFHRLMGTVRAENPCALLCGHNKLKLSHLTSVRQMRDGSVNDYIKRFHDTKNGWFS